MQNQYQLQKKLINKEFKSCPTPANIRGERVGETSSPKITMKSPIHRVIIKKNRRSMPRSQEIEKKVMQFFPTAVCNVTAWRHSSLRAHWLMTLVGGGGLREKYLFSAFPGNCSITYLSFVYGRSLWAELNGRENSLHWKANILHLLSIMTLWSSPTCNVYQGPFKLRLFCDVLATL